MCDIIDELSDGSHTMARQGTCSTCCPNVVCALFSHVCLCFLRVQWVDIFFGTFLSPLGPFGREVVLHIVERYIFGNPEASFLSGVGSQICSSGKVQKQLVDCDTVDSGCNGEFMDKASASAKKNAVWTETGHSCMVPPHWQLAAFERAAARGL